MYVKLDKNGAPTEWPLTVQRIRFENKNVSFPADMSGVNVRSYGFAPFTYADPQEYDPQWQEAREQTPVEVDGVFVQQWEVVEKYTPEEKEALIAEQTAKAAAAVVNFIRSERDYLLQQTDWMALSDTPPMSEAWASYRQALRDITDQAGFPYDVTWPEKPSS